MNLKQPTERVIAAAQRQDLEALSAAVKQRGQALEQTLRQGLNGSNEKDRGELEAAYEGGEIALAALGSLKRRLQAEHSRWQQMRGGFEPYPAPARPTIDLKG